MMWGYVAFIAVMQLSQVLLPSSFLWQRENRVIGTVFAWALTGDFECNGTYVSDVYLISDRPQTAPLGLGPTLCNRDGSHFRATCSTIFVGFI